MKARQVIFLFIVTTITFNFVAAENIPSSPQLLAEVNNHKIYSTEIDEVIKNAQGLALDSIDATQLNQVKKQILSKMIDRMILVDAATRKKISPSENVVTDKINAIKQQSASAEEFKQVLAKNNLSEKQLLEGLREDLAIENYLNMIVFNQISVSEKDIENYYQKHQSSLKIPKELHLKQILVRVTKDDAAAKIASKEKMTEIYNQASASPDKFSEFAEKYSEGSERFRGGDIGFVTKNQLDQSVADVVFSLNPGEMSGVLESQYGFHIFQVQEKKGDYIPPLTEIKTQLQTQLLNKKKLEVLEQHLAELRKNQRIIIYLQ